MSDTPENVTPSAEVTESAPAPETAEATAEKLPESEMSDADAAVGRRPPSAPILLPAPEPHTVSALRSVEATLAGMAVSVSCNLANGRVAPADRDASIPFLLAVSEFNGVFYRHMHQLPARDAFVYNWGAFLLSALAPRQDGTVMPMAEVLYLIATFNALATAYALDPQGVWDGSKSLWEKYGYSPVTY